MTDIQYKRAPITEAVVEFRSATPVDSTKRKKALNKLRKLYANHNPVTRKNIEVEIKPEGQSISADD